LSVLSKNPKNNLLLLVWGRAPSPVQAERSSAAATAAALLGLDALNDHTYDMIQGTMANANRGIKQRRTFTLSPESLAYLEQETQRRSADSQSAVLDELLQEKKRERQLAALETAIGAYYDGLSDAEVEEDKIWGEFAGMNLALKEDEIF